jgi:hypothetical protein
MNHQLAFLERALVPCHLLALVEDPQFGRAGPDEDGLADQSRRHGVAVAVVVNPGEGRDENGENLVGVEGDRRHGTEVGPFLLEAIHRRLLGGRVQADIGHLMRDWVPGDISSYHRVFSRASWLLWPMAKVLATLVVALGEDHGVEGWVLVAGHDTVAQAKGKRVYGKGCHHDSVRSSHRHAVWRWGHRWVVLAILVKFPFARRPWALPVLVNISIRGVPGGALQAAGRQAGRVRTARIWRGRFR